MEFRPASAFRTLLLAGTLALFAFLLSSCGGGGGGGGGTSASADAPSNGNQQGGNPNPGVALGLLRFEFTLERAIPSGVQQVRFSGFDSQGLLRYGPKTVNKAPVIEFDDVPVTVVLVQYDLLANDRVVGTGSRSVTIQGGGTTTLADPDFEGVEAQLSSLSVEGLDGPLPKGIEATFQARGTFTDSSQRDLSSLVSWTVTPPERARITAQGTLSTLALGQVTVVASLGEVQTQKTITISAAEILSLTITPPQPSVAKGLVTTLRATANYTDRTSLEVTEQAIWNSQSPSVAEVDSGVMSALEPGEATIAASFDGLTATTEATVTPAELTGLQVNPSEQSLAKGTGGVYQALANFSDGSQIDVTEQVGWTVSSASVAAVDNTGRLTTLQPGNTLVQASLDTFEAQATLEVGDAEVLSLQITPPEGSLAEGTSLDLEALASFTDGTRQNVTDQVSWSSLKPNVATVDLTGLVTGESAGTFTIRATLNEIIGEASYVVTPATLSRLLVEPSELSLPAGLTEPLTATAIFSNNTHQDVTSLVNWSSSKPDIASIGEEGRLTAHRSGGSLITATLDSEQAQSSVEVTEAELLTISLAPSSASVAKGLSQTFVATGFYTDETQQIITDEVIWSSSTPQVATIDTQGKALGRNLGTTTVRASLGEVTRTSTLEVTDALLLSLDIEPGDSSLPKGLTQSYRAFGNFTDSQRLDLTDQVTWDSSTPSVAIMSLDGEVTALQQGLATVTAQLAEQSAEATLTVSPATLLSLTLAPETLTLPVQGQDSISVQGEYSDTTTQNLSNLVTWTSTNEAVATVSTMGQVTAESVGVAQIAAHYEGVSKALTLTVVSQDILPLDQIQNLQKENEQITPSADINEAFGSIVWQGPDSDLGFAVFANAGDPNMDIKVNERPSLFSTQPDVAVAPNGDFLVCWRGDIEGNNTGIWIRLFDSQGQALTPQLPLSDFSGFAAQSPRAVAVETDNDGHRFVVVWQDQDLTAGGTTILARRVEADGSLAPSERFEVPQSLAGDQVEPEISRLVEDNFVVTWSTEHTGDFDIFAGLFTAESTGITRLSAEMLVNSSTPGDQTHPAVDGTSDGDYAISWTSQMGSSDDADVFVRRFRPDGTPWENEFSVVAADNESQFASSLDLYPRYPGGENQPPTVTVLFQSPDGDGDGIYQRSFPGSLAPRRVNQTTSQHQAAPHIVSNYSYTEGGGLLIGGGTTIVVFEGHDGENSRGILSSVTTYFFAVSQF